MTTRLEQDPSRLLPIRVEHRDRGVGQLTAETVARTTWEWVKAGWVFVEFGSGPTLVRSAHCTYPDIVEIRDEGIVVREVPV